MKVILTIIDVTGTQNYIFGSNRLRESIGASELVAQATNNWVCSILNISDRNAKIEDGKTEAEIIYCGGGNAVILFTADAQDEKKKAIDFTKAYTKKLLKDAPNLEVVVSHSAAFEFENNDKIIEMHKKVMKEISVKKACRPLSSQLKGLAVSAQCASTGGTASFSPKEEFGKSQERFETLLEKYGDNYVSAEVMKKLETVDAANDRLKTNLFGNISNLSENIKEKLRKETKSLFPPLGFDNLGRTEGDTSFIGVVHTDGNGMGNRIKKLGTQATDNREWVDKMRDMSEKIEKSNLHALRKMTDFLASKLNLDEKGNVILKAENGKTFRLKEGEIFSGGRWQKVIFYPFRPIIFGGEDVAFICDGRIALDLTAYYLKALQETNLADGKPLYGRAGIALVKSHYPFRRAYDLAEDLARSAKERIKTVEENPKHKGKVSTIDWHLAFTGLSGSVKEIRKREYQEDKLCMRPLSICKTKDGGDWQTWENFVSVTSEFQDKWSEKRNKAKTLREVLRKREEQVRQFLKLNKDLILPNVKNCDDMKNDGWFNGRCGYFDALEMMDFYFSLDKAVLTDCPQEKPQNEVNDNE